MCFEEAVCVIFFAEGVYFLTNAWLPRLELWINSSRHQALPSGECRENWKGKSEKTRGLKGSLIKTFYHKLCLQTKQNKEFIHCSECMQAGGQSSPGKQSLHHV